MQYKVTNRIYSEEIYQIIRVDYISFGFTHLAIALQQPRMTKYLFWQRQIQCHQEDRPVDGMETDDIFTDQMQVCRPVFVEQFGTVAVAVIADTGDVVGQRIQPYVSYMFRIKVYRYTPAEGSTGYTQILQSRKQEVVHHLVLSGYRLDELRMFINIFDQARSVFTHFKEICFFFCRCTRTSAVRTFSVYQLRLCEEGFARGTVHSFVMSFVDISLIVQLFENLLYLFFMIIICGTDELVIRSVHQIPDSLDLCRYVIYIFLRCDACFFGFQLDLLTVLIRTGLEEYIVSLLSFEASDTVCQYDLVGITDMGLAGCVGNRRCHIKFFFCHCLFLLFLS